MPRNMDKKDNSKEIYHDINEGIVKKNITKNLNKSRKKTKKTGFGKAILRLAMVLLIFGISLGAGATVALWSFSTKLPDISKIAEYTPSETTEIYDRNNRLLAKLHDEENRIIVPLKDIPLHVQHAVIAMEDERFYSHIGIDPKGIVRAASSLIDEERVKGGASTITQQLARNLFLTPERKLTRKFAEWLLAMKIERNYTKSKILELYLNQVYWGHNAYGVEAAARTFFGKSVKDLDLAEASLIGGLLSSPEVYSPHRSMENAKWRQSLTLQNMVKNGFITQEQADKAKAQEIKLSDTFIKKSYKYEAPYFTSYVISLLREKYGDNFLRKGGLKVYTTMDPELQTLAEKIITEGVAKAKGFNVTQGALVSIDPHTGYIKSLVGGVDYWKSEFNRAVQAKRQPGSSFKPFVYLTAFKKGILTPDTTVVDGPVSYPDLSGVWSPGNYDRKFRGAMKVTDAVRLSINTVAVKTLDQAGVDDVIETAKILGVESYLGPNLSLALGTSEITPLEMATAYGVFAAGGKKARVITPILKIEDRNGNIIEDYSQPHLEQVYDAKAIAMLNEATLAVVERGTGAAARLPGRQVAGKTGTTSDHKDSWFIGYTPQLVTAVWIGNDNNMKMNRATGGGVCAPMWKQYMDVAVKGMPVKSFEKWVPDNKKPAAPLANKNAGSTTTVLPASDNTGSSVTTTPAVADVNPYAPVANTAQVNNAGSTSGNTSVPTLNAVEITPQKVPVPEQTPIQITIPAKKEKKNEADKEYNKSIKELESVKELYDGQR